MTIKAIKLSNIRSIFKIMGIFELKYSDQIFKLTACPNITTDSY
jgi:hypothetical protein